MFASFASVAFALGAGHLASGFTSPNASPYLAVGNTAIDFTPEPVKQFAIRQFGESDKLVLLGGMGLVILLLAVIAGLLSRRTATPGLVIIGAFGVIGVIAALFRRDLAVPDALPAAVALVSGLGVFGWLHRLASRPATAHRPDGNTVTAGDAGSGETGGDDTATAATSSTASRRTFVLAAAGVTVVAGGAAAGGRLLTNRSGVDAARTEVGRIVPANPPVPRGADFASQGTPSFITPNKDFYRVDTALSVPRIRLDDWRLRIHGMVDKELTLGFDDLITRRVEQRTVTMTCVSNQVGGDYVSTATFTGVPIRDLLDEVGVRSGAEQVFSTSVDGYTAGTPLDVLREADRGALLAYGMNGEALPAEHGFPVRMVTPGLYGYLSATKWLADMELTTFDKQTYWEERGWAERAPIKTQSRIDRPQPFQKFPAGKFTVAGVAWAQPTGIERVEVRVDGGPWQQADLATEVNEQTWRMWRAEIEFPPGGHDIECRATDKSGYTQQARRVPPVPDGATGWHSIFCTAT
ncbi:DMSO/TMAO reductase YedYZ, molybdopterin-dependent catalytic subunit [Prauserella alba]|nr:DMSO/TMAO reductase YedYZ, molybdopterin-dependent catalytic subunit [Prauserella alba]